jgi:type IV pilus assembly protein PilE
MSTLKRLQQQARRRDGKPAFTLLELIVVLLVLGILAAIATPTFNKVKENSVRGTAQATLEAAARNGEAIAASDRNASDEDIAAAVEGEFADVGGLSVTVSSDTVTVTQTSGSVTATGSVEFNNGVASITDVTTSGSGGGGSAQTWSLAIDDAGQNQWRQAHTLSDVSYNPSTKVLTYTSTWACNDSGDFRVGDASALNEFGSPVEVVSFWRFGTTESGSVSGNNFVLTNDALAATRSDNVGSPCTYTVYLAAIETFTSMTFTDSKLQDLRIIFHNGSWEPKAVKLVLS